VAERKPSIVHLDEALAVIEKPAGLVVHPAPSHRGPTLVDGLAEILGGGDPERPGIVHRLDKETSGLLVVARDDATHAALQAQVQQRQVERVYLALAGGRLSSRTGTIDAPIGRDRADRQMMSVRSGGGRAARTHFEILEAFPRTTLLRVRLETGRTHQIRAHMAAIGHPVCGDPRYGGAASGRRLGLTRQFLHSAKLRFRHPITGADLTCESKPPADLQLSKSAARREPVSGGPDGDYSYE
jgi:23S rRNA pseudouridine1911/1915/1917 synthase